MLPIEAIFHSISKTLGSLRPNLPSPEIQIAREEVVGDANGFSEILTEPEDRANLSNSESSRLKLSESRSDSYIHENSPEGSTFSNQSNAWYRKALLSLGKNLRS